MATARRGAKACLWRDLLGKSLPYSGNVKNGAIRIHNPFADEITDLLGLPRGWLDNPTFPPASLSAWVMNRDIPLPTTREQALGAATAKTPVQPVVRPQPVPKQASLPTIPGKSAAKVRGVASAGRAITPKTTAAASATVTTPPATPRTPVPATPARPAVAPPAPAPKPVATAPATAAIEQPAGAAAAGYVWTPNAAPQAQAQPGPLAAILIDQLQQMAKAGTFTERDALNLLHYLMNQ